MNPLLRIASAVSTIAVLVALTVLGIKASGWGEVVRAGPGDVTLVAIDMANDVVATNEEDSGGTGTGTANCGDAADNDGDTLTDGDDPDCWENNEDSVGAIDGCGSIPNVGTPGSATVEPGTDLWFDLFVQGVDSSDKIMSYQFDIDYDPAIVEIIGVVAIDGTATEDALGGIADGDISILSRIDSYGGAGFDSSGTETALPSLPDNDGSFTTHGVDGTDSSPAGGSQPDMHEPTDRAGVDDDNNGVIDDAEEGSPDGVLARIRARGIGTGVTPLTIPSVLGGADSNPDWIIANKDNVVVDIEGFSPGAVIVGEDTPVSDADSDCISDDIDNCPDDANADQADNDGEGLGDVCDPCPDEADCDGDEFTDYVEALIGTDPLADCPATSTADDEDPDAFPPDFDDNRVVNLTDVFQLLPPYFGSGVGDANYSERRDLAPDGYINITDVFNVLPPVFGSNCTPS